MHAVNASMGEVLIAQGGKNDAMYIVLRGQLQVLVDGNEVSVLTSGAFF